MRGSKCPQNDWDLLTTLTACRHRCPAADAQSCQIPDPYPAACRPSELDSHTFWLMEQASSKVGDELVLNLREGAPIRITKAQVCASTC